MARSKVLSFLVCFVLVFSLLGLASASLSSSAAANNHSGGTDPATNQPDTTPPEGDPGPGESDTTDDAESAEPETDESDDSETGEPADPETGTDEPDDSETTDPEVADEPETDEPADTETTDPEVADEPETDEPDDPETDDSADEHTTEEEQRDETESPADDTPTTDEPDETAPEDDTEAETPAADTETTEPETEEQTDSDPVAPSLSGLDIAGQGTEGTLLADDGGTVDVTVENPGDSPATFEVTLQIGDAFTATQPTAELDGGDSETVTFPDIVESLEPDRYTVTVSAAGESVSGTLTVEDEAELGDGTLVIESASLGPDWVQSGHEIDLQATVRNTGETAVTRTLIVAVDDEPVGERDVTVDPGETVDVAVPFEPHEGGVVTLNGIEVGTIEVGEGEPDEPADDDGTGFGFLVVLGAAVVLSALFRRRSIQ